MLVKTIAAGTKEKFQLNYVPEKLIFKATDSSDTLHDKITAKVTPLGVGVICDLDAQGVTAVDTYRKIGGFGSGGLIIVELPLADGLVPDRVTDYEIENLSSTTDIKVYAPVSKKGTLYVKSAQQTLLEKSQVTFDNFMFLAFNGSSENSQVTVDYEGDASHTYSFAELIANNSKLSVTTVASLDNTRGIIRKVIVIPDTTQVGYKVSYMNLI